MPLAWLLAPESESIVEIQVENTLCTEQIKIMLACEEIDYNVVIDAEHDKSYIIWCSNNTDKKKIYNTCARNLLQNIPFMFDTYDQLFLVMAYNKEGSIVEDMNISEEEFVKLHVSVI